MTPTCPRTAELVERLLSGAAPAGKGVGSGSGGVSGSGDITGTAGAEPDARGLAGAATGLDGAADGDDHARTCPICAAELAEVRAAFFALPDAASAADPAALSRIERAVMREVAADLVTDLQRGRAAARWLPVRGVLASLGVALAVLGWHLKGGHELHAPLAGATLALLPLCLAPLLRLSVGVQRIAVVLSALLVGAVVGPLAWPWPGTVVPVLRGAGCLGLMLTGILGPAAALWSLARGSRQSALTGALFGVAIFAGGTTIQRVVCDLGGPAHALVFHLGPFLLGVSLLAWLARRQAGAVGAFQTAAR